MLKRRTQIIFSLLVLIIIVWLPGFSEEKDTRVIVLPVFFYMPETSFGFGAGTLVTFNLGEKDNKTRPSSLLISGYYTLKKQFAFEIQPELYFKADSFLGKGYFSFSRYPTKYFGIGNDTPESLEETYTPQGLRLYFSLEKKVLSSFNLYAGIQYKYEHFNLLKTDPTGFLREREIPGSQGGTLSGIGVSFNHDSRDNIFYPQSGNYFQVSVEWYSTTLGSDFPFTRFKMDLRKYVSLFSSHTIAFQLLLDGVSGTPPFHQYPQLGGDKIMRGYYYGRFRDNILAVLQAEYRLPLTKKLGAVVFAGLGRVAESLRNLNPRDIKYSFGVGLRYFLAPKEIPCVRMDFGLGHKTSGFYFTVRDAF